ncbi:MAG TPA: 16S rRNA (cytosine(1402)-N(4))-methyltransferase RsmH [Egicoccus sp.]|nr:16S rRNA (cytosine(1402)-N(4))-methyltransferase RsmH [Egicoccus sp.]HSK22347.1 16S rRNA (cytosine(1402)-N(4))-methyltransferase RsmH [Egicoccus sp.]
MTPPPAPQPPAEGAAPHTPVMLDRVVELFAGAPPGVYVDGTLGAAGHAVAVLRARADRYGTATLVGLDRDPDALDLAREHLAALGPEVTTHLVRTRFDAMGEVLDDLGIGEVAAIFLDLGISSMHVDRAERGFSYRQDGPLDMRMDPDLPISAADLVNDLDARDLARILRRYGDEKFADRIARAVVAARPFTRTTELAEVVRDAIPAAARRTGGHPATRTFQALRIAVNAEIEALEHLLPDALDRLAVGGVFAVLSYHSLEDRAVKRAFAEAATGCICPPNFPVCACGRSPLVEHVIRRPERPDADEAAANPRATAARLRAVRRLES